ncbi:tRNA nucleotidyltransferase [Bacillus sp. TS-2]|nr:tRNA nucleotidyltransferase [Bacillus sp. TS-2]
MQIIHSHTQLDFDGFASMIAAQKLYPQANLVLPEKQNPALAQFLAIHRDHFRFLAKEDITWSKVDTCIIVDVTNPNRIEIPYEQLKHADFIVYDHHPINENRIKASSESIVELGASVTLLIEKIIENNLTITPFEATLFGLGLYSDTGHFTYDHTTARDLEAASFLFHQGLDLDFINQFSEQSFSAEEQILFKQLLISGTKHSIDGLTIFLTIFEQSEYVNHLAFLTGKLLETTEADAAIAVVKMNKHVYVVARGHGERINVRELILKLGGNGHELAASATVKRANLQTVYSDVESMLPLMLKPAITAAQLMSSPVKVVHEKDKISYAAEQMQQFGHTGLPVLSEDEQLVGVISRKDVDKALRHDLGHAPIKAYMTTEPITVLESVTLEHIQELMIAHNIGRVLVERENRVIGIISRSDMVEVLHNKRYREHLHNRSAIHSLNKVDGLLKSSLSSDTFQLLKKVGEEAEIKGVSAYLIGGFVRDLLLKRQNQDIDIVIVGDAIAFGQHLASIMQGQLQEHQQFGTATLILSDSKKIDLVTCRTEYYKNPAELPTVHFSNLKEDLARRDFSINAMAISLNTTNFGELIDYFNGKVDLVEGKIRILHTLSFVEDPTRIFRAVRFAHRLKYRLDSQTRELAKNAGASLKRLSYTRILAEIHLIQKEKNGYELFYQLDELCVWNHLFNKSITTEQWHLFEELLLHKQEKTMMLLTALIFESDGWIDIIMPYALTVEDKAFLQHLIEATNLPPFNNMGEFHKFAHCLKSEALIFYALSQKGESSNQILEYVARRNSLKRLLNGHDLKKLDVPVGPIFKEILLRLEQRQLNQELLSREEAINWVKEELRNEPY